MPGMDLAPAIWMDRCAAELVRLWPGLAPDDAAGIARELWTQADDITPEQAARDELQEYRRLTR